MDQASEYLSWNAPDGSMGVRIGADVARRLNIEIMRGFGVTRRRGTESGGLLLGRFAPALIFIEDFEPVSCEYAFGPSYVLSESDQQRFSQAAGRDRAAADHPVIGYFRGHTREGLALNQQDVELVGKYLGPQGAVVLLLKPYATREATAALFFPENGTLSAGVPGHEFPFSVETRELIIAPAAPLTEPTPEPVPAEPKPPEPVVAEIVYSEPAVPRWDPALPSGVPPAAPDPELTAEPRPGSLFVPILLSILFAVSAVAMGFIAGYQTAGGRITALPTFRMTAPGDQPAFDLGLRTEKAGDRVRLRWTTESNVARTATGGTLYIDNGGSPITLKLESAELRAGTVLYSTAGADTRFRLEFNMPGNRTLSQTVSWPAGLQ